MIKFEELEKVVNENSFLANNLKYFVKQECSYCSGKGNTKMYLCYFDSQSLRARNAHKVCVERYAAKIKELSIKDIFTIRSLFNG